MPGPAAVLILPLAVLDMMPLRVSFASLTSFCPGSLEMEEGFLSGSGDASAFQETPGETGEPLVY
jgi:hypothetical protein